MTTNEPGTTRTRPSNSVEVGERFGALTVTKVGLRLPQTPSQVEKRLLGSVAVLTVCDCGEERLSAAARLIQGKVHACLACQSGRPPEEIERRRQAGAQLGGRKPMVIETDVFAPIVAEFIQAAALDAFYAVAICEAAVRITEKREKWSVRKEVRSLEIQARAACSASALTSCEIQNACGTGSCPWATPELAAINEPPTLPGVTLRLSERPKPRTGPGYRYSLEPAIQVLVEQRRAERDGRPAPVGSIDRVR